MTLNVSRDRVYTISPMYLHPHHKHFLPYIYSLNLPSFSLKLFPPFLLQQFLQKICPTLSFRSPLIIVRPLWSRSSLLIFRRTAPTLSACSHRRGVPSLWQFLCPSSGPSWRGPCLYWDTDSQCPSYRERYKPELPNNMNRCVCLTNAFLKGETRKSAVW